AQERGAARHFRLVDLNALLVGDQVLSWPLRKQRRLVVDGVQVPAEHAALRHECSLTAPRLNCYSAWCATSSVGRLAAGHALQACLQSSWITPLRMSLELRRCRAHVFQCSGMRNPYHPSVDSMRGDQVQTGPLSSMDRAHVFGP